MKTYVELPYGPSKSPIIGTFTVAVLIIGVCGGGASGYRLKPVSIARKRANWRQLL
jgi:hypothetical protein